MAFCDFDSDKSADKVRRSGKFNKDVFGASSGHIAETLFAFTVAEDSERSADKAFVILDSNFTL